MAQDRQKPLDFAAPFVRADGQVTNVRELAGAPLGIALPWVRALGQWQFTPGRKDGHTVAVEMQRRGRIATGLQLQSGFSSPMSEFTPGGGSLPPLSRP